MTTLPVLSIVEPEGERSIPFVPGFSVREILDTTDLRVRSSCGGVGACGLCLVRIVEGAVREATTEERDRLGQERTASGMRLACQVRPSQDLRISIEEPAPTVRWRSLSADDYLPVITPTTVPARRGAPLGVAVDLGTTQVRVALWNLEKRLRRATRAGLNPQVLSGADVLTRLTRASEATELAVELGRQARAAVGEALQDIVARESCAIGAVGAVVIVGNTAMTALLTGVNYRRLLEPENWQRGIDCSPRDTRTWCISWGIPGEATVEVVQPFAGFVGSDLLGAVLATRLADGPPGSLLIDFGANSEIALWDGAVLWVTSTAGGPAFEGSGISYGMPAEPGAIRAVTLRNDTPEFDVSVIGGADAAGICGSGIIDVIAALRSIDLVSANGRFTRKITTGGLVIHEGRRTITLSGRDIDAFQRAKAAVAAGVLCLARRARLALSELRRVCVCGAFGRFVHTGNAQAVGLLPSLPAQRIERCGNAALAGCELLLFDHDARGTLAALTDRARAVNLAEDPEFEDLFIEQLALVPLRGAPVCNDIPKGGPT